MTRIQVRIKRTSTTQPIDVRTPSGARLPY